MHRGSQSLCVSLGFLKCFKVDQMLPGLGPRTMQAALDHAFRMVILVSYWDDAKQNTKYY